MKRVLTFAILGMFVAGLSAGLVGCHAEGSIGDNDGTMHTDKTSSGSSYEKKTTVDSDGNKTTKTETKNY